MTGWQALFDGLHAATPQEALAFARQLARDAPEAPLVVSACLLGISCRYDGAHKGAPDPEALLAGGRPLPLCPEVLARLGVPRSPMSFVNGDGAAALAGAATLKNAEGQDCTAQLAEGVGVALDLARAAGCTQAVLKARSPSCGVHQVHTHRGLIPGCGMFTAACLQAGIAVRSDEDPR